MPEYIPEPFLHESWDGNKSAGHEGENQEDSANKIFNQIETDVRSDKELLKYFESAKKAMQRYRLVVQGEKEAREGGLSAKEIEERNQIRRRTHNRMVDDINLLSRQFQKKGLDNSWRRDLGQTNEQIGRWVESLNGI